MRARIAARQDEIARTLVDDALDKVDKDGRPMPDIPTLLKAIDQALGRPGEAPPEPEEEPESPMSIEDELAAYAEQLRAAGLLPAHSSASEPDE